MASLTDEQMKTFREAAAPMVKWLNDNVHPHTQAHITPVSAELVEGTAHVPIEEFVKD